MPIYVTPGQPQPLAKVTTFLVQAVHPPEMPPERVQALLLARLLAATETEPQDAADVVGLQLGISAPVTTLELRTP